MRFVELGVGRSRLQEQRAGPLQAQVEIDQGQRLRIVGERVQIERTMNVPEALAGQPIVGVELQGAAERLQSTAKSANARVTEAAEGVLEHAQAGQHLHGVEEIQEHGQKESQRTDLVVIVGEDAQAEAEAGGDDADLDFGFLLVAGEGQQVEERDAQQDLHGEDGLIFEVVRLGEAAELAEPVEEANREAGGQRQDQADARQAMAHLPQRAEGESGRRAAAEDRQEQLIQSSLRVRSDERADPGDAAERAAENAGVNQRRTLQKQKQREHEQPAADAIAFAHLGQTRQDQGEEETAQGQQIDARAGRPRNGRPRRPAAGPRTAPGRGRRP